MSPVWLKNSESKVPTQSMRDTGVERYLFLTPASEDEKFVMDFWFRIFDIARKQ